MQRLLVLREASPIAESDGTAPTAAATPNLGRAGAQARPIWLPNTAI